MWLDPADFDGGVHEGGQGGTILDDDLSDAGSDAPNDMFEEP